MAAFGAGIASELTGVVVSCTAQTGRSKRTRGCVYTAHRGRYFVDEAVFSRAVVGGMALEDCIVQKNYTLLQH